MLDIAFAKPALPRSGALVLLVGEGELPFGVWQQADEATGGAIARAFTAAEFKGGKGKICTLLAPGAGLSRVVAVGLGKPAELSAHVLNEAGGHAVAAVLREAVAVVATGALKPAQAAEVALGAALRAYRFDKYRTKEKPEDKPKLTKLVVLTDDPARARVGVGAAAGRGEGRVPVARPGQRAAQRIEPGRDGRSLQEAQRTWTESRGAWPS